MNKLDIEGPAEMEQCHQMGDKQQNKLCPHTIVCCFSKFKEKKKVLANTNKLKNTGMQSHNAINENFKGRSFGTSSAG